MYILIINGTIIMPSEYRFIISRGFLNKICRGKENGEPKRRKEQKTLRAKKWYVGGGGYVTGLIVSPQNTC